MPLRNERALVSATRRVGVIWLCMPKASDPNRTKQPLTFWQLYRPLYMFTCSEKSIPPTQSIGTAQSSPTFIYALLLSTLGGFHILSLCSITLNSLVAYCNAIDLCALGSLLHTTVAKGEERA